MRIPFQKLELFLSGPPSKDLGRTRAGGSQSPSEIQFKQKEQSIRGEEDGEKKTLTLCVMLAQGINLCLPCQTLLVDTRAMSCLRECQAKQTGRTREKPMGRRACLRVVCKFGRPREGAMILLAKERKREAENWRHATCHGWWHRAAQLAPGWHATAPESRRI